MSETFVQLPPDGAGKKAEMFDPGNQLLRQGVVIASPTVAGNVVEPTADGKVPVEVASLPLPTGAAQDSSLATLHTDLGTTIHGDLQTLHGDLGTVATDIVQVHTDVGATLHADLGQLHADLTAALPAGSNNIGSVSVSNLPDTQPVSATALPLPTGAAADGTDGTGITPPTGATGIRGWLSGIYQKLTGTLTVAQQDAATEYTASPVGSGAVTWSPTSLGYIDTTGYNSIQLEIPNLGTGCTFSFQSTNDNPAGSPNWMTVTANFPNGGYPASSFTSVYGAAFQVAIIPVQGRYFRVNVTYGSGAPSLTVTLRQAVVSVGVNTVAGASPAGNGPIGNPVMMAGSDGTNVRTIKTDSSGNVVFTPINGVLSTMGASASGTVPYSWDYPYKVAGLSSDGKVRTLLTDTSGAAVVTGSTNPNAVPVSIDDQNLNAAQTQDQPLFTAITGDPTGDFAGVNLLESVISGQDGLNLHVNVDNPPKQDRFGRRASTILRQCSDQFRQLISRRYQAG